jgi:hypothetical protein
MRCVAQCWRDVRSEAAGDAGHRQGFATRQRANTVQPEGTALAVNRLQDTGFLPVAE